MLTRDQLEKGTAAELNAALDVLSKVIGEKLPKNGTNADKVNRILEAQQRVEAMASDDQESGHADGEEQPTPDAGIKDSAPTTAATAATPTSYRIRALSTQGFYRCGKFWPYEGREIAADQLSDKELTTLTAEKQLTVEVN